MALATRGDDVDGADADADAVEARAALATRDDGDGDGDGEGADAVDARTVRAVRAREVDDDEDAAARRRVRACADVAARAIVARDDIGDDVDDVDDGVVVARGVARTTRDAPRAIGGRVVDDDDVAVEARAGASRGWWVVG